MVFYVPEKVEYSARARPALGDAMAPGVVCDTSDEFVDVLERAAYQSVAPDASMIDRCSEQSGYAADRVIDAVLLEKEVPGVRLAANAS